MRGKTMWMTCVVLSGLLLPSLGHAEVADKIPSRLNLAVLGAIELLGAWVALRIGRRQTMVSGGLLLIGLLVCLAYWSDVVFPSDISEAARSEMGSAYIFDTLLACLPLPIASSLALILGLVGRRSWRRREADGKVISSAPTANR